MFLGRVGGVIGLVVITAVATTAHAQAPARAGERFLRLEELERLATEKNPTIGQADAIARAVSGRQRQARLYPNPIVGYSADDITAREPGRGTHSLWVQQSIITGGKPGTSSSPRSSRATACCTATGRIT